MRTVLNRITLSGDRLIRTVDGNRDETTLPSDAEVLAAYREHLGPTFDRVPTMREEPALSR